MSWTAALVITSLAAAVALALAAVAWRSRRARDAAIAARERDRHLAAVGNMAAVLAHQIRNPLASLKGHAQLLVEQLAGTDGALHAGYVVEEAVRIEQISTSLLDLTKVGSIALQPASPAELAHDVARQHGGEGRVRIAAARAPATWMLDSLKFHQVLSNLVDNALQATRSPQPVDVTLAAERKRLVVEVADRGPGVPAADRERIFESFVTTRIRGTGLGLSVARQFVAGHGGTIAVRDRKGGGAVFRVEIPAATDPILPAQPMEDR